jgi:hypothetical protein
MNPVLLLGIFSILASSMAIENGGKWYGTKVINPVSETYRKMYRKMYKKMREYSVRFLVRHHYETLKNENIRQNIRNLISKYYDSVYHYYNLTDEERDFIDNITGLLM